MNKFISILTCAIIVLSIFVFPASAADTIMSPADKNDLFPNETITLNDTARSTNSKIFAQYDTGDEHVDAGTVAARACYKSSSYATLDGYAYCNKYNRNRSMGAHTYSLVGNRSTSLYSTLAKFWQMEERTPSSSLRKTCPNMSSVVQAARYTTGEAVSTSYTDTATNTFALYHNPNWDLTSSYSLSIFSTLHNYYSSSNDFFMYPVVVNY